MEKKLSERFLEKHIAEFEINSMASGMFISEYDAKIYGEICRIETLYEIGSITKKHFDYNCEYYERKYDL